MKKRKQTTPLLSTLTVSMLCTSLAAAAGAHSIYQKYNTDGWSQPAIAVLMQGLANRDFPWNNAATNAGSGNAAIPSANQPNMDGLPVAIVAQPDSTATGNGIDSAGQVNTGNQWNTSVGQSGAVPPGNLPDGQPGAESPDKLPNIQSGTAVPDNFTDGQSGAAVPDNFTDGQSEAVTPDNFLHERPGTAAPGGASEQTEKSAPNGSSEQTGSSAPNGSSEQTGSSTPNGSSEQTGSSAPNGSSEQTKNSGNEASQPENSQPASAASPQPASRQYEFTNVTQEYFDDALLIGDSRAEGVALYSGWDNLTYYAEGGMTIYNMFQRQVAKEDGQKISVEEALQKHTFGKIYLEIGINEMGTGTLDSFMEAYENAVNHLRELQPDAILYLCGIMYVKQSKSESDPIFNNPNIQARNDRIAQLADGENIFYLDINELVTDETGNLNPDYTWDEVHLLGKYDSLWLDYFCSHGIVKEAH